MAPTTEPSLRSQVINGKIAGFKLVSPQYMCDIPTGLYALVNNAGVSQPGEIEWVSLATYRRAMEVNTFGAVRVTKAFLPLIRWAKGRVVNTSSGSGLHAHPAQSAYCMTKAALESFSDALRHEMHKWGVKVVIVEPCSFAQVTDIVLPQIYNRIVEDLRNNMEEVVKEDYGMEYFNFRMGQIDSIHHDSRQAKDTTAVIDAMVDGVTLTAPAHRYLVGSNFENYVSNVWLGNFPSTWTDSTERAEKEGDPKPAMLKKTN
ncbi:D-beta-hydroxybutyrate dehydrogenase, mitochondrial-like [Branchiostoma lanceolatum]|uniref:D-beta-hydroxybutyrate dehydrogenase, mitochondrial-like n=1 Tax=Branchiostoma lanceolatum TaxID=7740 RepID=UPI003451F82C